MYAMTSTHPDIAYAVGKLSRFTYNPGAQHWQAVQRVFKYLKGTMNFGRFQKDTRMQVGYLMVKIILLQVVVYSCQEEVPLLGFQEANLYNKLDNGI